MRFTKMQGLGNDYIYLDCINRYIEDVSALAIQMSDRHFGVGGDGIICIYPSACADFRMEIYNADGSRAEMCGNGIRCVGKYVYDHGLTHRTELTVETLAGIKDLRLCVEQGKVAMVLVDMGIPEVSSPQAICLNGQKWTIIPVSMGNPHVVLMVDKIAEAPVATLGPQIERHPIFPDRTNVEFVTVSSRNSLAMRVWERGSGETLACGTGACAALAACVATGQCDSRAEIILSRGKLWVDWDDASKHIFLTGPAATVFEGEWPD